MILYILLLVHQITTQTLGGCQPFGLRLTYGEYFTQQGGSTQLYVGFNTIDDCPQSYVGFGNINSYSNFSCTSQSLNFTWQPSPYFNTTIFSCPITNIDFSQLIIYTAIGVDTNNNSFPFMNKNITTQLEDINTESPLNFVVIGDWNYYSPLNQTMPASITNCLNILKDYSSTNIQGIIFVGDQAYDLSSNNGTNYVEFLIMLQSYSSIWPFMSTPGNHESLTDSSIVFQLTYAYPYQYDLYYTFVLGYVTFVAFDPNAIVYNLTNSTQVMQSLLSQLRQTLTSSTTTFNIPFSHYPFFCSQPATSQCATNNQSLYPIQQLFNQLRVDAYLSGHIHNYEREYPTNQLGIVTDKDNIISHKPGAPIYILEGDGGNTLNMPNSTGTLQYFTAFASLGTGFGILSLDSSKILQYNHIDGSTCASNDSISAIYGIDKVNKGFPVWAIVVISIIGASAIAFVIFYFCYYRKKKLALKQINRGSMQQITGVYIKS